MQKLPNIWSMWQHHNGNVYRVLMLANVDSNHPCYQVTVIYEDSNGKVWAKTLDNFMENMTEVPEC
ncbi:hypothetical protein [Hafnia phage yong3]|nr:hypothetical protein [Hafnia phage yong3]